MARHAPRPAVADSIRKLPTPRHAAAATLAAGEPAAAPLFAASPPPPVRPAVVAPLAPDRYQVQFTASRSLRDKIEAAKALLRHQNPSGDLASIVDQALTVLLAQVKKRRWGVGRKPRSSTLPEGTAQSRRVPDPIRRAVYERDGGRCTFVDSKGDRCGARGWIEIDHIEGYARKKEHTLAGLRLTCRAHNQYAAERMYGPELMRRKRRPPSGPEPRTS